MKLPPPQPPGEAPNTESCIPPNLAAALDTLTADDELVDALGREMVDAFTILKRAEWERYLASGADPDSTEVTPWEIDYYMPFH